MKDIPESTSAGCHYENPVVIILCKIVKHILSLTKGAVAVDPEVGHLCLFEVLGYEV